MGNSESVGARFVGDLREALLVNMPGFLATGEVVLERAERWSSITFTGHRVTLLLTLRGHADTSEILALLRSLEVNEFDCPGCLVVDLDADLRANDSISRTAQIGLRFVTVDTAHD